MHFETRPAANAHQSSRVTRVVLFAALTFQALPAFAANLTPNQWTPMNEPPMGVQLLGWDEIRYSPEMDGILFYGAFRSFTSENQNAIWLYRFKENRWRLLHINLFDTRSEMDSDGGHTSGRMNYDGNRKTLVYGGLNSMSRNDRLRTWIFDPRALVGWDANPAANTGLTYDGASTYVPAMKKCFQYGAASGTWFYDATGNAWSPVANAGAGSGPPGVTDVVLDAKRNRILAFGGAAGYYVGTAFTTFNDVWAFDLTAQTWSKLSTTNPPPPRGWPQMALSTASDMMLICGGLSGADDSNGNYATLTDTWVLDLSTLTWTQLRNAQQPTTSYSNHMAYDPVNDVFLLLSNQTPANLGYGYQCAVYALKYQGPQPDVVPAPPVIQQPAYNFASLPTPTGQWNALGSGAISAVKGWAERPALATQGGKLLLSFSEYDPPGLYQTQGCYVYAFEYSGGAWTQLGTSVSDLNAFAQMPSACYDATGTPVVSYEKDVYWQPNALATKSYTAGTWSSVGQVNSEPFVGFSALSGDSGVSIAWQAHPQGTKGIATYVAQLGTNGWTQVAAGGPLNVGDPTATRGQFPALVHDDQNRLIVAWSEQQAGYEGDHATAERIHVRRLDSNAWTALGVENPVASPTSRVFSFGLAVYNGQPVIASCEGTDGGMAQLIVRAWNGSSWTMLGSSALNVLGSGSGALKPSLVSAGGALYVAWPEFLPGCPPLLFVKKWDGAAWTLAGGPLNNAPGAGAVHTPVMSTLNGIPVVAWSEHDPESSSLRQVFVKMLQVSGPVAFFTAADKGALRFDLDASGSSDSTGTITTYTWNFGDGASGSGVTASHVYAQGGTYTVTLNVTDNTGASASTTRQIKVNSAQPPPNTPPVLICGVSANPNPASTGQSVAFSGKAADADGDPLTYLWDFGDGSTGTGSDVTHAFATPGTYSVQLTVSDGPNSIVNAVQVVIQSSNSGGGNGGGGGGTGTTALPMQLSTLALKLNFTVTGKDSLKLSGALTLPGAITLPDLAAQIGVGAFGAPVVLNGKGKAAAGAAVLTLSGKSKNGVFAAGPRKFSISIKAANLAPALQPLGFTNATVRKPGTPLQLPVVLTLGGTTYSTSAAVLYTATARKSGAAVLARKH